MQGDDFWDFVSLFFPFLFFVFGGCVCEFCVLFCFVFWGLHFRQAKYAEAAKAKEVQCKQQSIRPTRTQQEKIQRGRRGGTKREQQQTKQQLFCKSNTSPTCPHHLRALERRSQTTHTHTHTHTHTQSNTDHQRAFLPKEARPLYQCSPQGFSSCFALFSFFWYSARTTARATHPPQQASSRLVSLTVPQNTQRKKVRGEQGQAQANKQASTKQTTKQTTQQQQPEN